MLVMTTSKNGPRACVCSIGDWSKTGSGPIPNQVLWLKSVMRKLNNEQRKQGKEKK